MKQFLSIEDLKPGQFVRFKAFDSYYIAEVYRITPKEETHFASDGISSRNWRQLAPGCQVWVGEKLEGLFLGATEIELTNERP